MHTDILEYLDCDFVGVRMVTFLFGEWSDWREACIFCFECDVVVVCDLC